MKIEVPRAERFPAVGRDGHFVREHAVLVGEDFQRPRVFRFGGGAFVPTRDQNREGIVGGDAHLMGEDAGVDGARLLHLVARRKIRIDAVDTHRARIVKRHQEMFRGHVRGQVDGTRRQPYRCPVRGESAAGRIDAQGGDVMLRPGSARAGSAAAGRHIQIASRDMRPGILHARRERDRLTLEQRGARDIHVIVRQIGPDIGIERDLLGRRLRDRPSRGGQAAGDK